MFEGTPAIFAYNVIQFQTSVCDKICILCVIYYIHCIISLYKHTFIAYINVHTYNIKSIKLII